MTAACICIPIPDRDPSRRAAIPLGALGRLLPQAGGGPGCRPAGWEAEGSSLHKRVGLHPRYRDATAARTSTPPAASRFLPFPFRPRRAALFHASIFPIGPPGVEIVCPTLFLSSLLLALQSKPAAFHQRPAARTCFILAPRSTSSPSFSSLPSLPPPSSPSRLQSPPSRRDLHELPSIFSFALRPPACPRAFDTCRVGNGKHSFVPSQHQSTIPGGLIGGGLPATDSSIIPLSPG